MLDIKKEVREEVEVVAVKTIPVVRSVKQIKQLADVVETIQDHILDDPDAICSTDQERVEWMEELLEEFFEIITTQEVREDLLALARKSTVVRIDGESYLAFTIIPNTQYEVLIGDKSMYYYGSLEGLDRLQQLEEE